MKSLTIALCSLLVAVSITSGQIQFGEKERDLTPLKPSASGTVASPLTTMPALDGPIQPDLYFVGPTDVFLVGIWTIPPATFTIAVTPEGTLVIPTVGEIRVADLSLAQVREKVLTEIRKKYIGGEPTVTLMTPRKVLVSVTGAVLFPGRYVLNASDRIDRAVAAANESQRDRAIPFIDREEPRMTPAQRQSTRNIQLRRRVGGEVRVDLDKFASTRDGRWNPYLRDGDEVFVPRVERTKDVVAAYGAVQREGRFELAPGDSITDLLQLAHGFTPRAIRDSVQLARFDTGNAPLIRMTIDLDAIVRGRQPNIALVSGDRIVVPERQELREDFRASIEGEVLSPGTYPITRDRTKLSTLLSLSGGLTKYAAVKSAELIRSTTSPNGPELEQMLALRGSFSPDDSAYFILESNLRQRHEVVNVDFEKLVLGRDSTHDVILQSDDRVVIPSIHKTVYVFGQVVSPGNVPFVPGRSVSYYVDKADGLTDNARGGDIMIIKRSTRQWLAPGETMIEEGDYVWVPKEPQRSFAYYMNIIGQTASVIGVAVSLGLLVNQLTK